MSFKRKTVSLTSNSSRTPVPVGANPGLVGNLRGPPGYRGAPPTGFRTTPAKPTPRNILQHCSVRPSTQISIPTISTGSSDLDDVLGHMGLPLGSVLLLEESGNTDFASVLLRSFAALGITHNRLGATDKTILKDTKVVAIGVDESWGTELPGIYMDKKEKKKMEFEEDKAKVTVGNLANESAERREKTNLKIAWRYANQGNVPTKEQGPDLSSKPYYNTVLDYKARIRPIPSPLELEIIGGAQLLALRGKRSFLQAMLDRLQTVIEKTLQTSPETVIRIIIPSFLHPAIYPPDSSTSNEIVQFIHGLVVLSRKHTQNIAIMMSVSLELYPRESSIMKWVETLVDGLLHIDPFPEKIDPLSTEAPSDDAANKPYQGLVNIYKLPVFSERGQMVVRRGELAFRVGRKSFEIDEFGIPVEEAEPTKPSVPESVPTSGETDINQTSAVIAKPSVDLSKLDF